MRVPNKKLEPKRWHKKSRSKYAARTQKKWVKKFGQKDVPYFLQTAQGLFMHPATFRRLQEAITQQEKGASPHPCRSSAPAYPYPQGASAGILITPRI